VGVAASRMRASGRASELASDGDKRKKEQGKKRSKRREEALLQKRRPSLSPAKRLLVGKFDLTGVSLYWAHFTSIGPEQNENQLQFCFVYLTGVSLLAALHSAELGRRN
jgi:hypothetical protein